MQIRLQKSVLILPKYPRNNRGTILDPNLVSNLRNPNLHTTRKRRWQARARRPELTPPAG